MREAGGERPRCAAASPKAAGPAARAPASLSYAPGVEPSLLYDFLAGRVGSWRLRRELARYAEGAEDLEPGVASADVPFPLYPRHLLALCEAVAARELEPVVLVGLSRALVRSGRSRASTLDPDGRVVEEVLVAWSERAPADVDAQAMPFFRDWLVTRRRPERLAARR